MLGKIVHICLVGPYSDGFAYQENIMTKYHRRMGYEVTVITSTLSFNDKGEVQNTSPRTYIDDNGVKIIRLASKRFSIKKLAKYEDFFKQLSLEKPSIVFCHCCNFANIDDVRKYAKKNKDVKIFVDNHCDETNSGTNFISKNILHKLIWRHKVLRVLPYVETFYGVLPRRCSFLNNMYGVPEDKIKLLVMGIDDDYLNTHIQNELTEISIGGKIDEWKAKEIINFLKAFNEINTIRNGLNIHITVYGSISEKYKDTILQLVKEGNSDYVGWVNQEQIMKILANSSYAVFPGRHSVLWEQAVGLGIPIVVKKYDGYNHVDIGGNVVYLEDSSVEYYKNILDKILDVTFYEEIRNNASKEGKEMFKYSIISRIAINE